jgi:hypothetical protein
MTAVIPSKARTIYCPATVPQDLVLRFPDKDPGDTLDFTLDISANLADTEDTLIGCIATVAYTNLVAPTLAPEALPPNPVAQTLIISGGVNGGDYPILFVFTLGSGDILARTVWLRVRQISPETNQIQEP